MKRVFAVVMLLIFTVAGAGCSGVQVGVNEDAAIQAAGTIAGYKVGQSNPALIAPALAQIDALLAVDPAATDGFATLLLQGEKLLLQSVSDPDVQMAIQVVAAMIVIKEGVPMDKNVVAKVKTALTAFKIGLLMAQQK